MKSNTREHTAGRKINAGDSVYFKNDKTIKTKKIKEELEKVYPLLFAKKPKEIIDIAGDRILSDGLDNGAKLHYIK